MRQIPFTSTTIRIPFVPSSHEAVETMIELADIKPGEKAADLGSGDGRVVLALAHAGAQAHGYEIDEALALQAESKIEKENLTGKAFIHKKSYWEEDLSQYNIITIYGMMSVMENLEEKLEKDTKPGTKIVSNIFTFPNWIYAVAKNNVYLYVIP